MNHNDLTALSTENIKREIQKSSNIIENEIGSSPTLLRPPYGALNDKVKAVSLAKRLSIILWSVDSLDWKSRNKDAVNEEVMSHVAPGSIVLLHDIHPTTADALPQLLDSLEKEGYQMVTVSQLLELWGDKDSGPHYGKIG